MRRVLDGVNLKKFHLSHPTWFFEYICLREDIQLSSILKRQVHNLYNKFSMVKKIKVGIIFGGKSAEHEVSLLSARNVINALDKDRYDVDLIGIEKNGTWYFGQNAQLLLDGKTTLLKKQNSITERLESFPSTIPNQIDIKSVDVFFPVLHGTYGEDGTIQGLLKLTNKPFVGCGVLGSAIGMDKDIMKRLLQQSDIPVVRFLTIRVNDMKKADYKKICKELGKTLFIKPANMGSSVGVSKISNQKEFNAALKIAFLYDKKVLVEEAMDVREIECSVLGNQDPIASVPGEIIVKKEFYSYNEKYSSSSSTTTQIPAELSIDMTKKVQELAIKAFTILECEGMARVDFFIDRKSNKLYVNEINTIPGFTDISMYPKMWEASNVSCVELIDKLILLAFERHHLENLLRTSI